MTAQEIEAALKAVTDKADAAGVPCDTTAEILEEMAEEYRMRAEDDAASAD